MHIMTFWISEIRFIFEKFRIIALTAFIWVDFLEIIDARKEREIFESFLCEVSIPQPWLRCVKLGSLMRCYLYELNP